MKVEREVWFEKFLPLVKLVIEKNNKDHIL